jgi:DNA (cytosine-5)-methyltransferase 1
MADLGGVRPRLLDLFCGAGGAAVGYSRAGFDVVGVDIAPQPNYPFEFVQDDAVALMSTYPWWDVPPFQAVHASPPCQRYSTATKVNGTQDTHPDLIAPTRELLERTGLPYVIENVVGAPLIEPVMVCGVALGMRLENYVLRRHRLFETNWPLMSPGCGCHRGDGRTLGVYGGGPTEKARSLHGKNPGGGRPQKATKAQAQALMDMPWATKTEINEAIPPAYTELIGHQLAQHLRAVAA